MQRNVCEFKSCLIYEVTSRTARAREPMGYITENLEFKFLKATYIPTTLTQKFVHYLLIVKHLLILNNPVQEY